MLPEDVKIARELSKSMEALDEPQVPTPDFLCIKQLVDVQQAKLRRSQKRQLALFVAAASVLLAAVVFLTGISGVFLIALQCAAFTGAVAGLIVFFARSRRLGWEEH